ncbi:glycosyltransferase [Subtercola sp. YIM 133946]|uniref:glycosyltransferase n=1 Tax=Subtercola sp. YIM 133946 TaxID=3118909 RepID=UPI002F9589C8
MLIGGSPTRVLYLTPTAQALFDGRRLTVTDARSRAFANRLLDAAMAEPVVADLPDYPQGDGSAAVTWVVPVRDRPAALERLLLSLGHGHPIVVVDDCSIDPVAVERVAARFGARYLHLDVNVGPGGARNAGLAVVETPFVAFVDSDIVVEPDALGMLLRHFADDHVALACPRVRALPDGDGAGWIGRYEEARSSLDLGRRPATVRPRSEVSWVPSACLVGRVAALTTAGPAAPDPVDPDPAAPGPTVAGFSADLRVGEDVDLVWRLAEAGWRVRYEPAATVRHEHRTELVDWLRRKAVYGTGSLELGRRHPHDIAPVILAPWSAALLAAVLAQRRWSLPVAAALFVYAAIGIRSKLGSSAQPTRLSVTLTAQGAAAALSQGTALLLRHWWPLTLVGCLFSGRVRRAALVAGAVDAAIEYVRTGAFRAGALEAGAAGPNPERTGPVAADGVDTHRAEATSRATGSRLDPVRFALARRLDDLAYGGGVWFSALRGRSARALVPDIRRTRTR